MQKTTEAEQRVAALEDEIRWAQRGVIEAAARGATIEPELGEAVLVDDKGRGAYRVRVVLEGVAYVDGAGSLSAHADDLAAAALFAASEWPANPDLRAVEVEVEVATLAGAIHPQTADEPVGSLLRSPPFDPLGEWGAWTLGDLLAGYHRELPPARPSTLPELGRWILDPRQGERTFGGAHGWILRTRRDAYADLVDPAFRDFDGRADVLFTNGQSALEVKDVDGEDVDEVLPPVVGKRRDGEHEPGLEYEALASAMVSVADLRELALDGDPSLEPGEDPRKPVGDDGGPRVGLRFYEISAEPKVCARALGLWVVAPAEVAGDEQVLVEVLGKRFGGGLLRFTGNGWRAWLLGRGETVDDGPSLVVSIEPPPPSDEFSLPGPKTLRRLVPASDPCALPGAGCEPGECDDCDRLWAEEAADDCPHADVERMQERAPLLHGSAPLDRCKACGMWRDARSLGSSAPGGWDRWRPASELAEALREEDDL